jgi:hypothetical protein
MGLGNCPDVIEDNTYHTQICPNFMPRATFNYLRFAEGLAFTLPPPMKCKYAGLASPISGGLVYAEEVRVGF